MITQFKIYEVLNQGEPKVGDWICGLEDTYYSNDKELINYVNNHVGQLIKIDDSARFWVKYDDDLESGKKISTILGEDKLWWFTREQIKVWSELKKELEIYITAKRYNL
jgi:hypothetical protein